MFGDPLACFAFRSLHVVLMKLKKIEMVLYIERYRYR